MNILYGITTYGSAPYVDLSLYYHKQFNNKVIVLDDGSKSNALLNVCNKYDVPLFGLNSLRLHKPCFADAVNTLLLLKIGLMLKVDAVVKQSRRWICLLNPTPSLLKLINLSDGSTFSNFTTSFDYGFRTEFWALRPLYWKPVLIEAELRISKANSLFVEGEMHQLAKKAQHFSLRYKTYQAAHPADKDKDGYVHWLWMGTDKAHTPSYILWHDSIAPLQYFYKSRLIGLPYTLLGYKRVNDFETM